MKKVLKAHKNDGSKSNVR